ncbi:unnamed protein product [Mycena citricolor]|uniref:Uncharacterized protein n=1 Tax=Mycena citricolor TaxID=2018698 RepID=A0AAD2K3M6_9AGAR|nr:unnamed protein product [Mycena citricolor]
MSVAHFPTFTSPAADITARTRRSSLVYAVLYELALTSVLAFSTLLGILALVRFALGVLLFKCAQLPSECYYCTSLIPTASLRFAAALAHTSPLSVLIATSLCTGVVFAGAELVAMALGRDGWSMWPRGSDDDPAEDEDEDEDEDEEKSIGLPRSP